MDPNLVQRSLNYHGDRLLENLESIHGKDKMSSYLLSDNRMSLNVCFGSAELLQGVHEFVAAKSKLLFRPMKESSASVAAEDSSVILPPLEFFSGLGAVQPADLRKHFYEVVEAGDVVCGVVSAIQQHGIQVMLLCCDAGKALEIDRLKITAYCAAQDLPRINSREDPLDEFSVRDKVRGVVTAVSREMGKIRLSLLSQHLPDYLPNLKMGLITDEDLPLHYQKLCRSSGQLYSHLLRKGEDFKNPHMLDTMCSALGIDTNETNSFMNKLASLKLRPAEYADSMQQEQSRNKALESVVEGVTLYKKGKLVEAMQCYNFALKYDDKNVEAFVARAALEANSHNYQRAVKDLEMALSFNKNHTNAMGYLCQTLEAYGSELEQGKNHVAAAECYQRALAINLDFKPAQDALQAMNKRDKYSRSRHLGQQRSSDQGLDSRPVPQQTKGGPINNDNQKRRTSKETSVEQYLYGDEQSDGPEKDAQLKVSSAESVFGGTSKGLTSGKHKANVFGAAALTSAEKGFGTKTTQGSPDRSAVHGQEVKFLSSNMWTKGNNAKSTAPDQNQDKILDQSSNEVRQDASKNPRSEWKEIPQLDQVKSRSRSSSKSSKDSSRKSLAHSDRSKGHRKLSSSSHGRKSRSRSKGTSHSYKDRNHRFKKSHRRRSRSRSRRRRSRSKRSKSKSRSRRSRSRSRSNRSRSQSHSKRLKSRSRSRRSRSKSRSKGSRYRSQKRSYLTMMARTKMPSTQIPIHKGIHRNVFRSPSSSSDEGAKFRYWRIQKSQLARDLAVMVSERQSADRAKSNEPVNFPKSKWDSMEPDKKRAALKSQPAVSQDKPATSLEEMEKFYNLLKVNRANKDELKQADKP